MQVRTSSRVQSASIKGTKTGETLWKGSHRGSLIFFSSETSAVRSPKRFTPHLLVSTKHTHAHALQMFRMNHGTLLDGTRPTCTKKGLAESRCLNSGSYACLVGNAGSAFERKTWPKTNNPFRLSACKWPTESDLQWSVVCTESCKPQLLRWLLCWTVPGLE